jgi:hypothetical protein
MQEISIKKAIVHDMKKDVNHLISLTRMKFSFQSVHDVKLLDYHYTFWEEPQMSGRKLRKEGYLDAKLIETPTAIRRISAAATLKSQRHGYETWNNAYVTLRYNKSHSSFYSIFF